MLVYVFVYYKKSSDQDTRKARLSNQARFKGRIKRSSAYFDDQNSCRWKYRAYSGDLSISTEIVHILESPLLEVSLYMYRMYLVEFIYFRTDNTINFG